MPRAFAKNGTIVEFEFAEVVMLPTGKKLTLFIKPDPTKHLMMQIVDAFVEEIDENRNPG